MKTYRTNNIVFICIMSSTFTGFSEEDLKRIKCEETVPTSGVQVPSNIKKINKIGAKAKKMTTQYKTPILQSQNSDDALDTIFDKCKLSIKTTSDENNDINDNDKENHNNNDNINNNLSEKALNSKEEDNSITTENEANNVLSERRNSDDIAPDIVRGICNTEDGVAAHKIKLEELQMRQKLMEEQNKKRKEMLARALADRTRQTEEEVIKLEKIKKELQILDGQFSLDVNVLRKKIDQACLSYAEAEKHYFKVEKEFLQAKMNLQKEKEKKELLTEHLCALITHNETRKAKKLETLMLELASDNKSESVNVTLPVDEDGEKPVIIDGVDERTGKIVAINTEK